MYEEPPKGYYHVKTPQETDGTAYVFRSFWYSFDTIKKVLKQDSWAREVYSQPTSRKEQIDRHIILEEMWIDVVTQALAIVRRWEELMLECQSEKSSVYWRLTDSKQGVLNSRINRAEALKRYKDFY